MKNTIIAIFLLLVAQCTPQVFAQSQAPKKAQAQDEMPPKYPPTEGDIDMNQFRGLQDYEQGKIPENRVKIQMKCTDAQGTIIKKGEPGFETCIANSQSRLLKPNVYPEAPNDTRKR